MHELTDNEINLVSGGDMSDVYVIAGATTAAFFAGSAVGTPILGVALAASVFGHAMLIRSLD